MRLESTGTVIIQRQTVSRLLPSSKTSIFCPHHNHYTYLETYYYKDYCRSNKFEHLELLLHDEKKLKISESLKGQEYLKLVPEKNHEHGKKLNGKCTNLCDGLNARTLILFQSLDRK